MGMWIQVFTAMAMLEDHGSVASGCRSVIDDQERLACYDAAFGNPHADPGEREAGQVPDAGRATQPAAPPAAANSAEDFGLTPGQKEAKVQDAPPPIESISSIVTGVEQLPRERYVLTLENGQVWLQIEPTSRQLFYAGDAIVIRKASLNSFLADGKRTGAGVRVRRME